LKLFNELRRLGGVWLLALALDLIPKDAAERLHVIRALREMREYQKYVALLQVQGATTAKTFHQWRYERERFQRVAKGAGCSKRS
jgi:hypothetical protein